MSDASSVEKWVIKDTRPCYWCARPLGEKKHDRGCPGENGIPSSHLRASYSYEVSMQFYKPGDLEREARATEYYGIRVLPPKEWG